MIAFSLPGGDVGCLLVHGFGGNPNEMLPLGTFLNSRGYSIVGVQLPGHGTDESSGSSVTWKHWLSCVLEGYEALSKQADVIFILGHSTGAILSLIASTMYPTYGVIAYAPISHLRFWQRIAISLGHKIIKFVPLPSFSVESESTKAYKKIPTNLVYQLLQLLEIAPSRIQNVNVPVLIIVGGKDKVVPKDSALQVSKSLINTTHKLVNIPDADHMIMVANEREKAWETTLQFIRENEPVLRGEET